jgi:hypothetical protein
MVIMPIPSWASDRIECRVKMYLERADSYADGVLRDAAERFRAWPVYSDMGGRLLLGTDGVVYSKDDCTNVLEPVQSAGWKITAWLKAAEQEPELARLLPQRPIEAEDCAFCGGLGFIQVASQTRCGCGQSWRLG